MALYEDMVSDANDWKTQDSRKLYDYIVVLEIRDGDEDEYFENTIESYSVKAYNEEEATEKALNEALDDYDVHDINVLECSQQ